MAYVKTTWREHSMNTAAKLTALDNLETLYTEAVNYIDGITHAASYYTEAQADAKYFTSSNDGTGSGLICQTLDGMSAQQIIDAGTPSGCIAIWSGSTASIPSGWYLCNGLNSTPDLRDKFIPGAGSHYSKADTGGAATVTTSATVTIAGHALTADEMPKHVHSGILDYYGVAESVNWGYTSGSGGLGSPTDHTANTDYAGSGSSHTHTASFSGTSGQAKMVPYYAACFIMKS